jgi:exo beta-1,2-glucooligosaccharide sophorohydrolase (non-reducing end)
MFIKAFLKYNPLLVLMLLSFFSFRCNSQTYLYFQDSPSDDYYDYSWMELTSPSELERKGTDLHKFPVEYATPAIQGLNSLRLKWKSEAGGSWVAIAAGSNWTEKDIDETDTVQFWLYSVEGLVSDNLPLIFMEDVNNTKTTKHLFSSWCGNLPAGIWIRVTLPMSLFLDAGDPVDFTKIKTIGFAQNAADGVQHTLFIDNMRAFAGNGSSPAASKPAGLSVEGFDSHFELRWNRNPEDFVTGYALQRSVAGASFVTVGLAGKEDTLFIDHVRDLGILVTAEYRISALNASGELSVPSDTVSASTRVFSDDELLDMVQHYTFRYFWDFAHQASGMARERNTSENTVTTGGSGFGIMAILVGIKRGFITREQGILRMKKILSFLETADRFHGAWPHWMDGNTGKVIPFGTEDNGGDLVETGFLMEGLLTARQYFDQNTPDEEEIVQKITTLWSSVEWNWYRQNNSNVLYWHWSPDYAWYINMQIRGWNEAAIIYMLAIASPTYAVPASLWQSGWAGMSYYRNGKSFYGYKLDVGPDKGGPLFFAHYSFLGFDPRDKKDAYANYFENNRNHTLINRAYCIANPFSFAGYNENCWGLTASDDPDGYLAHEPYTGRDNGTITPTASLSSMPYTPEESIGALKYLYRNMGKKIWGPMGFYDAFNQKRGWYATSYLAIDQGPIVGMIENYRSQLLWNNFMANTEIQQAQDAIGFTEDIPSGIQHDRMDLGLMAMPNPMGKNGIVRFNLKTPQRVSLYLNDACGRTISVLASDRYFAAGEGEIFTEKMNVASGVYFLNLVPATGVPETITLIIQE